MEVPLPLTAGAGPSPKRRFGSMKFGGPPDPERFEEAVSHCSTALAGTDGPVWCGGLESLADGRCALLAAGGPVWCTFRCDREGRTAAGADVLAALIVMEGMGCAAFGLEAAPPEPAVQRLVMSIIYEESKRGERGSREKFAQIDRALASMGCDCAILGCTELSVFRSYHSLPPFYVDAMEVLAELAVVRCGKQLRTI